MWNVLDLLIRKRPCGTIGALGTIFVAGVGLGLFVTDVRVDYKDAEIQRLTATVAQNAPVPRLEENERLFRTAEMDSSEEVNGIFRVAGLEVVGIAAGGISGTTDFWLAPIE